VSGSFSFTIDEVIPTSPVTPTRTAIVPVGGCSVQIRVEGSQIRVMEQPQVNTVVSSITVTGTGSLASTNLVNRTAIVMAAPLTTTVTFTNKRTISKSMGVDKNLNPAKL
jgi:hypothetical protein